MTAPAPSEVEKPAKGKVPVVPGHWLFGSIDRRRKDPLRLFEDVAALGDVAAFRALWLTVYCVNSAEHVKQVLLDHPQSYRKGKRMAPFRALLGDGLLLSEGETWKHRRRLMQPAFHREALAGLVEGMAQVTEARLAGWTSKAAGPEGLDVVPEMMALTMSVVAQALFNTDVTSHAAEVREALNFSVEETNTRMLTFNPLRSHLPTPTARRFAQARDTLDRVVLGIIEARKKNSVAHPDLLGMLMGARDEDTGEGLSPLELRDEVMTLFLAGHETTANLLSWFWYVLAGQPEVEGRIRAELAEVLGGRRPTSADLPQLRFTTRALEETMRLYPPIWVFSREPQVDVDLGTATLPAGSIVVICPYLLHRHPRYWKDPERFDPDRFLPENVAQRPKQAYLPFGAGQRQCIGNAFAMAEALVVVASVLSRFKLTLVPGQTVEPLPQVTLRPKGAIRFFLEPLSAGAAS